MTSKSVIGAVVLAGMCSVASIGPAEAQQRRRQTGPVIENHGGRAFTDTVGPLDWDAPSDREYKAVFEMTAPSSSPDRALRGLERVARYVNLHAAAGVPLDKIKVAVVIHGGAMAHTVTHEVYRAANNTDNPSLERFEALADAGVQIYLCAQSASFRGMKKEELAAPIKLAYSAMSVLSVLQADGYGVIVP